MFFSTYQHSSCSGVSSRGELELPSGQTPPHQPEHSAVWIGFHYRHSGIAGVRLGRQVAHWTLQRYFRPVHGHEQEDSDGG